MIPRLLLVFFLWPASIFAQEPVKTAAETQLGYQSLRAALHVHSQFSDGDYEVSELASLAHERKIDVLGITDSFLTRVRYGVGPLKKLLSRTQSRSAVLDQGIVNYLAAVSEAQGQFKDVVLLPGLEVAPYYYWQGQPGSLRLYDFDRHLVLFGLQDSRVIADLPVIENSTWSNTTRDWMSLSGPLLTLAVGLIVVFGRKRPLRMAGGLTVLAGLAWTYDAYPFGRQPDPYSGKPDWQAFQRLIDYAAIHGGMAFWSYPEARYPDVQVGGATMVSHPQPESLALTRDYRGFEGIYGENRTITNPGNLWDQILLDYIHGGRKVWPSVITGIDFHSLRGKGGWHDLDRGLTMLWTKSKELNSVLDALRRGRGYATFQRDPNRSLELDDFALHSTAGIAIAGETITTDGNVTFSASIHWAQGKRAEAPAQVDVVRDGELLDHRIMALPAEILRKDTLENGRHYYRIRVTSDGSEIMSNPIFCSVTR
jgi:hypothetical protein